MKFIDDISLVQSLDLKKCLIQNEISGPRPLQYHSRTGHILPESENVIQEQATKLHE